MKMKIDIIRNGKKLLDEYGPELACGGAIACLGMALYSAFKGSKKVVEANEEYQKEVEKIQKQETAEGEEKASTEVSATVAKKLRKVRIARDIDYVLTYKWALLFGGASAFLMILSRKLSGTKIAGLTAALCMSEDKLKKLGGKVKDIIGEEELNKLKAEIRQEQAEEIYPKDEAPFDIEKAKNEGNLASQKYIYDDMTGTMFEIEPSHLEDWKAAALEEFRKHGRLDFNKFRSIGGLEDCKLGKYSEWNANVPFLGFEIKPMHYHDVWIGSIVYTNDPIDTRFE